MRRLRWGVVAVSACLLLGTHVAGASNNAAFSDPAGDSTSAAPDLTSVSVANDDAAVVTFHISIPNRPALLDADLIEVLVDADGKSGTGCARCGLFFFPSMTCSHRSETSVVTRSDGVLFLFLVPCDPSCARPTSRFSLSADTDQPVTGNISLHQLFFLGMGRLLHWFAVYSFLFRLVNFFD